MSVFRSSLTSCFPGMLLTCFLNDFEIVPVVPIITGITFVFTSHIRCISIVRSLYFRIFSASFLMTFLSHEIATSVNIHVPFSLSRIILSDLFIIIFVIISILIIMAFIRGVYNHKLGINYVSRICGLTAIIWLKYIIHVNVLHFYNGTSGSLFVAPSMDAFCSSLMSGFLVILLRYFLHDFQMVPFATIITGNICFCILHVLYFYCKVFIF